MIPLKVSLEFNIFSIKLLVGKFKACLNLEIVQIRSGKPMVNMGLEEAFLKSGETISKC